MLKEKEGKRARIRTCTLHRSAGSANAVLPGAGGNGLLVVGIPLPMMMMMQCKCLPPLPLFSVIKADRRGLWTLIPSDL